MFWNFTSFSFFLSFCSKCKEVKENHLVDKACLSITPQTISIAITHSHSTSQRSFWMLYSHSSEWITNYLFSCSFSLHLSSPQMHTTCLAPLIMLDLVVPNIPQKSKNYIQYLS
jgi:hypothetical protein